MKAFEGKPYPQFRKGMQFQVADEEGDNRVSVGDIATLIRNDNDGGYFETQSGVRTWLYWKRLAPLESLTDKPHPGVPEETKFLVVKETSYFTTGEIVTLTDNDNTSMPKFKKEDSEGWYLYWSQVAPLTCLLKNVTEMSEPIVYEEAQEEEDCSCEKFIYGVRPRWLLDEDRMLELLEAMTRYADASKSIPQEWLEELEELNASL